MTDAIQQDVPEKRDEIIVGNIERNEMVASIAERARQERDEEIKAHGGEVIDTTAKQEEKPEELEEKAEITEPEVKEVKEAKAEEPEAKPETVQIKVDGELREVPKEKILDAGIRAMQKESTADKRLEEATRLLREIEAKYAQPAPAKVDPSPQWDDATVAYALEHGTEEQKAYAVSQLRGRETTTPEQIEQNTERKILDKLDFMESSKWFSTEYKEIVSDPYLLQLASIAEDKARANGDVRPRKELYQEIGDNLRKWKGGVTAETSFESKKEQKSNIVNLTSASVKKSAPEVSKPKTATDIIDQMRKSRGQA